MAQNDDAVLQIGSGNFYRAVVGTAPPEDLTDIEVAWSEIGHTSLEDILSMSSEGGEVTTLGTLQKKTLRQARSSLVESWNFNLQQWDEDGVKLYFGSNAAELDVDSIWLTVPDTPVATESAFLVVVTDGVRYFGMYAPKAELFRGDDFSLEDTESLSSLPIQVTPLNHSDNDFKFAVTPLA